MNQLPARNITVTGDYPDATFFYSLCDCADPTHSHRIIVGFESDDLPLVNCSIYQTLEWAYWNTRGSPNPIVRFWQRIVHATKYLFTGYVAIEGVHTFDEESLRDYANALLGAIDELQRRHALSTMRAKAGNNATGGTSSNSTDVQGQGDSDTP